MLELPEMSMYDVHSRAWVLKHFAMAATVSCYSKDESTKCGSVIVRPDNTIASTGYNGFPRGISYSRKRLDRPAKYMYTEHSERNAIYNCQDQNLDGYSLFVYTHPKNLFVCSDCARAIIQSGIKNVFAHSEGTEEHWEDSCEAAKIMFDEAGVKVYHPELPDYTNITNAIKNNLTK